MSAAGGSAGNSESAALIKLSRSFELWVRYVLIQLYVEPNSSFCEVMPGKSIEFTNLFKAKISRYAAIGMRCAVFLLSTPPQHAFVLTTPAACDV